MRIPEFKELAGNTSDAVFAVDGSGVIVAWNSAAEALFGISPKEAIGRLCGEIVQGADECGAVCSPDCSVQKSIQNRQPVANYDIQVSTARGKRWCNFSVIFAEVANSAMPYSLRIVRDADLHKRLELVLRDFVVAGTGLPAERVLEIVSTAKAPARAADLSKRELEILLLIAKGATTEGAAKQLHIGTTTVNNHIQHILQKLNAHTRLQAVRRAEMAGLL